jgi:hypothetical protein
LDSLFDSKALAFQPMTSSSFCFISSFQITIFGQSFLTKLYRLVNSEARWYEQAGVSFEMLQAAFSSNI